MFLLQAAANTQITWITVIASFLGGGIGSALISFFATRRLKGVEFRYDYRKYILEKRKKAYDSIEGIINHYYDNQWNIENGTTNEANIKADSLAFRDMIDVIFLNHEIWLSPAMSTALNQTKVILTKIILKDNRFVTFEQRVSLGIELGKCIHAITTCYFVDIIELDSINTFRKSKEQEYENKKITMVERETEFRKNHKNI